MPIRCKSPVRNHVGYWTPGAEVADPKLEDWLLRDSPGSWERVGAKPKADPEPEPEPTPDEGDGEEPDDKATEAEVTKPAPRRGGRWAARTK